MEELHKQWQKQWREILGVSTDDMPNIDSDYDMICDVWHLEYDKLEECFSLFPNGDKMFFRIKHAFSITPSKFDMDDKSLLELLDKMNCFVAIVLEEYGDKRAMALNAEKDKCLEKKVYRGDSELARKIFKESSTPTFELDEILYDIIRDKLGKKAEAACYFLGEPLYMFGGNSFVVKYWIMWAMVEEYFSVDPYQIGYELGNIFAQAGWGEKEMFVYIEE